MMGRDHLDLSLKIQDNCMKRMTFLKTPSNVLGIFSTPKKKTAPVNMKVLVLDNVSDPGNLGSIIRLCD